MPIAEDGTSSGPSYFLVSVSTRENLELCIKYGLAGFPSGQSGAWTFCEIEVGDFISFLYGARAHNLYRVVAKKALRNADRLPPWPPLTFTSSGKTYYFPFRLQLQPVRKFVEPLVRAEFSYVAENLLLRGGYRKTHFQADQTTLQSVSQMGEPSQDGAENLSLPVHSEFVPRFTRNPKLVNPPEVSRFVEFILQTAIRHHLSDAAELRGLLERHNLAIGQAGSLELIGEKALTQGHVDLLLKPRVPLGSSLRVPMEVKLNKAEKKDLAQLRRYMDELGECPGGILVADGFGKNVARDAPSHHVKLVNYHFDGNMREARTFDEICRGLHL